jgi:Phosphoenolpyruvate carboxylase
VHDFGARTQPRSTSSNSRPPQRPHSSNSWDHGSARNSRQDLPLREDIRLLGRILGDTVRSQEGEPVFVIVEHIRRTSIRFHRDEDEAARHELEATLNSLSYGQRRSLDKKTTPAAGDVSAFLCDRPGRGSARLLAIFRRVNRLRGTTAI